MVVISSMGQLPYSLTISTIDDNYEGTVVAKELPHWISGVMLS